jgi:hypothetical protein
MLNQYQKVKPKEVVTVSRDIASDEIDLLTEKIRSGKAFLKVFAYPWGVEFDVCEFSVSSRPVD